MYTVNGWLICCAKLQVAQVPRSWDNYGEICAHDNDNDTTDYFTPCACTRGNYEMQEWVKDGSTKIWETTNNKVQASYMYNPTLIGFKKYVCDTKLQSLFWSIFLYRYPSGGSRGGSQSAMESPFGLHL
jgi:hypothetical protein